MLTGLRVENVKLMMCDILIIFMYDILDYILTFLHL